LLAILAAEGFYSLKIAWQIQVSNTEMRHDFLSRDRRLEQIRSALYESGNVVRDYVLVEPGENKAETLRTELKTIRDDMETALKVYSLSLRPEDRGPFQQLATEVGTYWSTLEPIFDWDAKARRNRGNWFLRHEVLPRRTTVLAIAREVSELNEQELQEDEKRVADLFARFQRRLQIITALGLGFGLVLAVQEALSNCSKHAGAKSVRIIVRQELERLLLTIKDDGKGFDVHRVRGLGLIGMSERVTHLSGTFEVESREGRGTLLRIELPLGSGHIQEDQRAS
jgi:anti-sigma regulatory factor (Ser/Thr protein kinase)